MQHPPKKQIGKPKSRRLAVVLLLAGVLLAAAFVGLIPQIKQTYQPKTLQIFTPTASTHTFEITPEEKIAAVKVFPPNGPAYQLRMHGGVLWLEDDGELTDINDAYAQELLNAVTQIVAQGVVTHDAQEVAGQLQEMGLASPRASALIEYTDGTQTTLTIGASVPNTTYSYCQWSANNAVYMCDSGVVDALTLSRSQLLPVKQPVIYAGLLDRLTLQNANGAMRLVFQDGAYGRMEEPHAYPLDATAASQLLAALDQFRLGTFECELTDENRSAYGFTDPLCVLEMEMASGVTSEVDETGEFVTRMRNAQSLRFVIGRPEGDFFYTCEYEGSCYLVSRFLVERFIAAKPSDLLSRRPLDVGDLAVERIVITTSDGRADLQAVRTERVLPNNDLETDAQGNVICDTTVTLNGSPAAVELLDEVITRLDGLSASVPVPEDYSTEQMRWSVLVQTESGLVRTVEATRLDLFTDVLSVDGTALFCVDSEAIDIIAEGLI